MKYTVMAILCCLALTCMVLTAGAAVVTSSFSSFVYTYTIVPSEGEAIKDFHVYVAPNECSIAAYLSWFMPAGWNFTIVTLDGKCALSWWTTGAPLPVGVAAQFGYTHYCAPCCHSWIVTETGTDNPLDPPVDGSWNHVEEPCNIPAEYSDQCYGGGLVVAPRYPDMTPVDDSTWGRLKVLYR